MGVRGGRSADRPRTVVVMSLLLSSWARRRRALVAMVTGSGGARNRISRTERTAAVVGQARRSLVVGIGAARVDPVPVVVDVDDAPARPVQQARGDAGAVTRAAVHPDLARGQLSARALDVLDRHVQGAGKVAGFELVALPDVAPRPALGQRRGSRPSRRAGRPRPARRGRRSTCVPTPSMPMPARSRRAGARSGRWSVVTPARAPRHQPSDVRRELGAVLDADRPGKVTGAKPPGRAGRRPRRRASAAPGPPGRAGVPPAGTSASGAGPVEWRHVLVVGGDGPEAGHQVLDETVAVVHECGVGGAAGRRARRRPVGAVVACSRRSCRSRGSGEPGRGRQLRRASVRCPTGPGRAGGGSVVHQVRAADGAVEQAAAAEERARAPAAAVRGEEGLVVPGVAGGVDHPDLEPPTSSTSPPRTPTLSKATFSSAASR